MQQPLSGIPLTIAHHMGKVTSIFIFFIIYNSKVLVIIIYLFLRASTYTKNNLFQIYIIGKYKHRYLINIYFVILLLYILKLFYRNLL